MCVGGGSRSGDYKSALAGKCQEISGQAPVLGKYQEIAEEIWGGGGGVTLSGGGGGGEHYLRVRMVSH